MKITFEQQAKKFLEDGKTRKRNPLRPETLRVYKSQIDTNLIPSLGKLPLQDVGNKAVKQLVAKMAANGLSGNTITLNKTLIKQIRKSAVNEDGDQLFPIVWNEKMIDAPAPNPNGATVTREGIQEAISRANDHDGALYALLAGTGLRIAEARALQLIEDDQVSTIWLPAEQKIIVRQQMTRNGFGPTKTDAGQREVDLAPELNHFLVKLVGNTNGLVFPGKESGYGQRLKKNGIDQGFHSFRRFRITHLNKMNTPTGLEYFWTGHEFGGVHGRYVKFGNEIETRRAEANRVGLGFELPELV